jgi:hypothetical protein
LFFLQDQTWKSPEQEAVWWLHMPFDKDGFEIRHISEDIGILDINSQFLI